MTGFPTCVFLYPNRVSINEAFGVLEPDDGKLSRPVLRGPGHRNGARLLGHHLTGPMRPTHRHSSISPHRGLYALSSLCAIFLRLGDPRVGPCFRWHTFSTCHPPRPREVHRLHTPSSFTDNAGLRPGERVSALPTSPPSDSRGGSHFGA